jgi:hypothetical protein
MDPPPVTAGSDTPPATILQLLLYGPQAIATGKIKLDHSTRPLAAAIIRGGPSRWAAEWQAHGQAAIAFAEARGLRIAHGTTRWFGEGICARRSARRAGHGDAVHYQQHVQQRPPVLRRLAARARGLIRAPFPDDCDVGIHESAHAVIGRARGIGVRYLFIADRPRPDGIGGGVQFTIDGSVEDRVVAVLAAREAHIRLRGSCAPGIVSHDLENAALFIRLDKPEDPEAALERCRLEAEALVRTHWKQIERVARELRKRRRLSGDELEALLHDKTGEQRT